MKILISGSTGLVGSALVPALQSSGHEMVRLVRSSPVQVRSPESVSHLGSHVWTVEHSEISKALTQRFTSLEKTSRPGVGHPHRKPGFARAAWQGLDCWRRLWPS